MMSTIFLDDVVPMTSIVHDQEGLVIIMIVDMLHNLVVECQLWTPIGLQAHQPAMVVVTDGEYGL